MNLNPFLPIFPDGPRFHPTTPRLPKAPDATAHRLLKVIGLVLRPRFAGGAAGNGPMVFDQGRPLQVWEIAKQLTRGIAFAKRLAGEVRNQLLVERCFVFFFWGL